MKKKQKDPAVLFYTQDFLVGTISMSYEEKGRYITLLCIQHQKGFLTEKDLRLHLTEEDIEVFAKFTKDADGKYYNQKLRDEAERRKTYTANRLKNFNKAKDTPISNPHMNTHMEETLETETGTETATLELETDQLETAISIAEKMKQKPTQKELDELNKL
jgi:hypothetical protein